MNNHPDQINRRRTPLTDNLLPAPPSFFWCLFAVGPRQALNHRSGIVNILLTIWVAWRLKQQRQARRMPIYPPFVLRTWLGSTGPIWSMFILFYLVLIVKLILL